MSLSGSVIDTRGIGVFGMPPGGNVAPPQPVDRSMASIIDTLVNQLLPVRTSSTALSAPQQSAVIEAVVLANSPLLQTGSGDSQFKVTLASGEQRLELTTNLPIPPGATVQLKLAANNLAVVLAITEKAGQQTTQPLPGQLLPILSRGANLLQASTPGQPVPATNTPLLQTASTLPTSPNPAAGINAEANPIAQQRLVIDQLVRQALPQQQPLRELVPVLQSILTQPQPLPRALGQALTQLLARFPTPQQLQTPAPLKQAVRDSGIFLESKLSRPQAPANAGPERLGSQAPAAEMTKPGATDNRDLKALIERVLPQLQKLTGEDGAREPGATSPAAALANSYGLPPGIIPTTGHSPPHNSGHRSAGHTNEQSLDVLLRQLSRQLMASLARTQMHQMDSLTTRQAFTQDPQSPINTWALEIPILNGNQVENLDLRIEQHQQQDAQQADKRVTAWTVMLNFDLHQSGRMQVQLTIIEKTVSAVIWSQLEKTHQQVQRHIRELQQGFEKVGVLVKKVECQIGIPAADRSPLYRQLVDVHT